MKHSRHSLFVVFILIQICAAHAQQRPAIALWPDGAPGAKPEGGAETVRIHEPTGDHEDMQSISTGMAELYLKFKKLNIPAELHIYANAHHGFGIRQGDTGASSKWPAALIAWLHDINKVGSER